MLNECNCLNLVGQFRQARPWAVPCQKSPSWSLCPPSDTEPLGTGFHLGAPSITNLDTQSSRLQYHLKCSVQTCTKKRFYQSQASSSIPQSSLLIKISAATRLIFRSPQNVLNTDDYFYEQEHISKIFQNMVFSVVPQIAPISVIFELSAQRSLLR